MTDVRDVEYNYAHMYVYIYMHIYVLTNASKRYGLSLYNFLHFHFIIVNL